MTSGSTSHLLSSSPEPPAFSGSSSHNPIAGCDQPDSQHAEDLAERARRWTSSPGETCEAVMLFMPNQAATASGTRMATQT